MSIEQYKGMKVEYHILQSFPVTCLNRDDVGAPKTAVVGGVTRARVSSQSWKRQVRLAMQDFGIKLGVRTKHVEDKIAAYCIKQGASAENAHEAGRAISDLIVEDTLHFFSDTEAEALASYAIENNFKVTKDALKIHKKAFTPAEDGLDIALFGRMVAKAADLNVEAAASFSHAISTHRISNEVEFFTALDDFSGSEEVQQGSSHMGSLEFNSATYYRYIGLDLYQLVKSLGGDDQIEKALEAFTKALFIAVPEARQNTQAGYAPWDYAQIMVRKGQNLQVSFENPVKSKGNGFSEPSITELKQFLDRKEKQSGSLFGKIAKLEWGLSETYSVDDLITDIQSAVKG